MASTSKILLFLYMALFLTHLNAVSSGSLPVETQTEESHVPPTSKGKNETFGFLSHVKKRFANYPPPCKEISSIFNPQKYFNTRDVFIPRFGRSVVCAGAPNNPPSCGPLNGYMQCVTRMGTAEFMRMPSYFQCWKKRRVVISNVPVGCYCV